MNKKTIALLAGVLVSQFVAASAMAQSAPAKTNAPGTAPVMRDRSEFLAKRLGLTEEQRLKVKPILDEQAKKMTELSRQSDMKPDEKRAKYMTLREETNAKLKTILTPEQYQKMTSPSVRPSGTNAPAGTPPAK